MVAVNRTIVEHYVPIDIICPVLFKRYVYAPTMQYCNNVDKGLQTITASNLHVLRRYVYITYRNSVFEYSAGRNLTAPHALVQFHDLQ